MRATESREDYLEAILMLSKEKNYVRSVDVADRLGVTKPSVSRAISLLRTAGMIAMDPHDGALTLTEEGRKVAERVYGRQSSADPPADRAGGQPDNCRAGCLPH